MTAPPPTLVGRWKASERPASDRGVGLTVINFNTAKQTLRCLASINASLEAPAWVLVLDNASQPDDFHRLQQGCSGLARSQLRLYRSDVNLGFAAGSNFLINELMAEPDCHFAGLLNNDAVAMPAMVSRLVDAIQDAPQRTGLAGGRMHKLLAPDEVDTLGITVYASLMPADRKNTSDPYLGPTGGCCLMTRELIDHLLQTSGYCFDERFFCYCEDTDLVLRANLLGYEPAYVDEVIALHEGQASSGGGLNRFIAYHGIRNSIWMQMKLMPTAILVRYGALLLLAHVLSVIRHTLAGHGRLLLEVYRDAWKQRRAFLQERGIWARSSRLSARQLMQRLAPRFYRAGYWRLAWGQLVHHRRRPRAPGQGNRV